MADISPDGTAFESCGPDDAPVVVLIHGLGLNRAVWQWQIPTLTERYRVLAYDLFGHGKSAPPPARPTLSLFSAQLRDLLDHCHSERAAIIGFSLGGMIARRFAQDLPHRAVALGVLNSPYRRSDAAQAAILERIDQAGAEGPSATVEAALKRWFTDGYRAANPQMMDLVRSWVLANDPSIYPGVYRVLADGIDEIVAPSPPIRCPALVLTGDEDYGNGPEMTRAIAAEIEGSERVILQGLRHMALAENPDAVNAPLLSFLDRATKRIPQNG